jgi:hypothetical protein
MQIPAAARQQLLNRILASRQFAHAHTLKRILQYLYERDKAGEPPKEYGVAVQAMGRPENFDPRTDPIVRVSIASIRERLLAYFATEGKDETWLLSIPKGQYRLCFCLAKAPEADFEAQPGALARFWRPYFEGPAANIIFYTEPLFFRDSAGHYYRDWYTNDPAAAMPDLQQRLAGGGFGPIEPAYHYLSTGEVHCLLSLSRMFHEAGVQLETCNTRTASWNEVRRANAILLGSPRTNSFLSALQGTGALQVAADYILDRRTGTQYRGTRYRDGNLLRGAEYAVVTRRPGLTADTALTMIAANHGRAIEGAGYFLTLEDKVKDLLDTYGLNGGLGASFQLLIRVETFDIDDEAVAVTCVAAHCDGRDLP